MRTDGGGRGEERKMVEAGRGTREDKGKSEIEEGRESETGAGQKEGKW